MQVHLLVLLLLALLSLPVHGQRARCGTPERDADSAAFSIGPSDCGYGSNTPQPEYDPSFTYDIPVVFHVIQDTSGAGFLSAATIQDQIDVLNEDFQALPGTPGGPGTNGMINFRLASVDPSGRPTTGITYSTDNNWFQDNGNYWNSLAWDTNRYLNIYTNAVPCCYGYAYVPQSGGVVGQSLDRIVLWWEAVGRDPTAGWPGNMGRTATHEVGHYLGLWHTFDSGCGSTCDTTGDLICDTNAESSPTWGCPSSKSSCGNPDPIHNYMDYTDDLCLWEFTPEQVNRMRCTLQHWRPNLPSQPNGGVWTDLGHALAGTSGAPLFTGSGLLLAGEVVTLTLSNTKPLSSSYSVIGFLNISAPFKGGVIVPSPDLVVPMVTDGSGGITLPAVWPAGVPPDFSIYMQWWIPDAAAVKGFAGSNALLATTGP